MASSNISDWSTMDEDLDDNDKALAATMTQSCISATSTCPTCFESTQKMTEEMNRKMEDIVNKMNGQIESLKLNINLTMRENGETSLRNLSENDPSSSVDKLDDEAAVSIPGSENPTSEKGTEAAAAINAESPVDLSSDAAAQTTTTSDEQQVLYSKSFLPAQRTAPVFLPDSVKTKITADEKCSKKSLSELNSSSPVTVSNDSNVNQASAMSLPKPLQPEATLAARQVEIMSQYNPQPANHQPQVSDDEDFHSTSDVGEHPTEENQPSANEETSAFT